jgi:hypothetical protein
LTTRRTVLAAAAGVAAGTALPLANPVGAAAAASLSIPQTLARSTSGLGRSSSMSRTPFPLSHLAIGWTGEGQPGARIRSASGWSDWRPVRACHAGKDGADQSRQWAMLTVPGAIGYEIEHGGQAGALSITELNTVDGPVRGPAAAAANTLHLGGHTAPTRYLSRAGWGADESLRFGPDGTETWPPAYFPVQTLTVHHTAGANDDPNPAATVRAIYYYHAITQGWGDVGYHLLIDEAGTVYEGRWSGSDPVPVFGTTLGPDGRPQMVNAAHVLGFNAGNVGVALMGDFTSQLPTRAARGSLTAVLAILGAVERLHPLGITDYVNPISGATRTVSTISGHRDWAATQCPGDLFYPQLPAVRHDVSDLLGG